MYYTIFGKRHKILSGPTYFYFIFPLLFLKVSRVSFFYIQAPFFPIEATKKGATPNQFGPVFGITYLAQMCVAPIIGKIVANFGVGTPFKCSWIIYSVNITSFAFLSYINNRSIFLAVAYFLRFNQGIHGNVLWSSVLSILILW